MLVKVRGAADSVEPGVERSGTPGTLVEMIQKPAERPTVESVGLVLATAIARYRGLSKFLGSLSWGFAALHPRLYAVARYRGLPRQVHCWLEIER